MSIETYTQMHKEIEAWKKAGMLTYAEALQRHMDLRRDYLLGKGSWLLPVVL